MKRMSFALTKDQIRKLTKRVTRRDAWLNAKAGDRVLPIEKGMGLPRGSKQVLLLPEGMCIEFVDVRREPLEDITQADVVLEGFPDMTREEFIAMYRKHGDKANDGKVSRIEFDYVEACDG